MMEEKSYLDIAQIEFKASDQEDGIISGYASTFGNIDRHGDIIEQGAFKDAKGSIPIFINHDPSLPIGKGKVVEDEKGLKINMELAINAKSETLRKRAEEYFELAKLGIVNSMSVGFISLETDFEARKIKGVDSVVRVIKMTDLLECSLVATPANPQARIVQVKTYDVEAEQEQTEVPEPQEDNQKSIYLGALIAKQFGVF
jgi:HK97 family phage prohead protease